MPLDDFAERYQAALKSIPREVRSGVIDLFRDARRRGWTTDIAGSVRTAIETSDALWTRNRAAAIWLLSGYPAAVTIAEWWTLSADDRDGLAARMRFRRWLRAEIARFTPRAPKPPKRQVPAARRGPAVVVVTRRASR